MMNSVFLRKKTKFSRKKCNNFGRNFFFCNFALLIKALGFMTVVTGREFRANQSKYIGMAQRGERVILSSRVGYAELTPLSKEDKDFHEYVNSKAFLSLAEKVKQEYREGKGVALKTAEEIETYLNSL
ncbi:MAG: hypothetical protein IJT13_03325 [Bacteroidaceae bacterium]|nr:hypothetical protein [Bacteroidaceae bacterium]